MGKTVNQTNIGNKKESGGNWVRQASFSGFWNIGTISSCLIPGSGIMGHMDNGLEYDNLKRDVIGV